MPPWAKWPEYSGIFSGSGKNRVSFEVGRRNSEWGSLKVEGESWNSKLNIIRPVASLPRTREADIIARQLLKAGTSVGANYREACRSRSRAEFRSKIGIVEQEADESLYIILAGTIKRIGNSERRVDRKIAG